MKGEKMILTSIIFILMLVLSVKVTWWLLKLCGAILGAVFSVIGYLILAFIFVPLGIAMFIAIPCLAIVGLGSIITGVSRV